MRHPIRPLQYCLALVQADQRGLTDTTTEGHRLAADHRHRPAALPHQHRLQAHAPGTFHNGVGNIGRGQPGSRRPRRIGRLGLGRRSHGKQGKNHQLHNVSHVLSGLKV
jgi:hypothetical protein